MSFLAGGDERPIASLSLDLDNQWSYMKTHGDAGWDAFPSYLDLVVPRVLRLLDELGVTITFFIVGQDAALDRNRAALRAITDAGHEVGNHSFHHEPWLHRYTREQIVDEFARTETALEHATGQRPIGFRGPGYSLSPTVLEVLIERGYAYDASTLPTWVGPLARWYYFRTAKLDAAKREERSQLFGTWRDACRPITPYRWQLDDATIIEIPVTTMPLGRMPIHLSYVLYASGRSWALARAYHHTALAMCRATGVAPSILLHPLDFLGADDLEHLGFFPGMNMGGADKMARSRWCLEQLKRRFRITTMREHAATCARDDLPRRVPTSRPERP